jgi:excisionase family DNA binding protein
MSARAAAIPIRRALADGDRGRTRLLTAAEVADRLSVTPGWVYAATRANRLPHVRLGRYVRFRADAIERWLADLERAGVAPSSLPH